MTGEWLETKLKPYITKWELKAGVENYIALTRHKLYAPVVNIDEENTRQLEGLADRMRAGCETLRRIEADLKKERNLQEELGEKTSGLANRLLHPGTTRRNQEALAHSLAQTELLESRLKSTQLSTAELEGHVYEQFFKRIPTRIMRPTQPNVWSIPDEGFERDRHEFRFFGQRATSMVAVKVLNYLSLLGPAEVLAVLQSELDAYGQDMRRHFENDTDILVVINEMRLMTLRNDLAEYGDRSEEVLDDLLEQHPEIREDLKNMAEAHEQCRKTNFEVFYKHMNSFLRRILPLPEGFTDAVLLYIDDHDAAGDGRSGLFGILEDYFRERNIVFDVDSDSSLAIGDFVCVRIGKEVCRRKATDELLGVRISYELVEVEILGGCTFQHRSYYNRSSNQIFLEDVTRLSPEDFYKAYSTHYSAEQAKSDALLHERAHAMFEVLARQGRLKGFQLVVLSEVFARLVTGYLGVCVQSQKDEIQSMQFEGRVYSAAFGEIMALPCAAVFNDEQPGHGEVQDAASDPCEVRDDQPDQEEVQGVAVLSDDQPSQGEIQDVASASREVSDSDIRDAFRTSLLLFCQKLADEHGVKRAGALLSHLGVEGPEPSV